MIQPNSTKTIRQTFDNIASFIDRTDGISQTLIGQMEKVKQAYAVAQKLNDPEVSQLAEDHAKTFILAAQTSGLVNMARVNKEQAKKTARFDNLTGSGNRRNFDEILAKKIEQTPKDDAQGQYTAMIALDLDRFKGLNDDYGHATGDIALKEFAMTLRGLTRSENHDTPERPKDEVFVPEPRSDFRFGGDEFALLITVNANSVEHAKELFEGIETRIKEQTAVMSFTCEHEEEEKTFPLLSSMGMHVIQKDDDIETVCAGADAELYEHKKNKAERYEACHSALEQLNAINLQRVADKRQSEAQELRLKAIGETIERLSALDSNVRIIVPEGTEPDAVQTLIDSGVTVEFEEQSPSGENEPG